LPGETKLNEISFEKIDTSGTGKVDLRYSTGVVMLLAGVLLFLVTLGKVVCVIGIGLAGMGYARLLQSAPKLHYFRYLWLDHYGIHHVEGSGPNDRTAHFSWNEIESVETSNDEFRGLILTLNRMGMQGVPILLSTAHADEAAMVIKERIEAYPLL
jgi:hypothetical protein